jgi:hypothetical protein
VRRRDTEVGRVMLQPNAQPARAVGVVAAANYHPAQGDVPSQPRHQVQEAGKVFLGDAAWQVADEVAVDVHRYCVRVTRVGWLWNKHRHRVAPDLVSNRPT